MARKLNLKVFLYGLLLSGLPLWTAAQTEQEEPEDNHPMPESVTQVVGTGKPASFNKVNYDFFKLSAGLKLSSFRDFATSPLYYSGVPKSYAASFCRLNSKKEIETEASYTAGNYKNNYNDQLSVSAVKTVSVYHSRLYTIKRWSNDNWNLKAGAMYLISANFRINTGLGNAAAGYEAVSSLMGSFKASRDISRTRSKSGKLLFIKYTANPRKRELGMRFNAGLGNQSLRNGYSYLGQAALLNESGLKGFFSGYNIYTGGLHFNTAIDYTVWTKNNNAWQISYIWDSYRTGGSYERFEMSGHMIRFSFIFHTNNK